MDYKVIEKDGDQYGFYGDIVEMLKSEIIEAIERGHYEVMGNYSEIFEELDKLKDYDGLIKISENNGMGWTAEKVAKSEEPAPKYIHDFFADAGAIMGQNLDTYAGELLSLMALYKHDEGVTVLPEDIEDLKARAESLAAACDEILSN